MTTEQTSIDAEGTARTKSIYDRNAKSYDRRSAMMERLALGKRRSQLWALVSGQEILEVGVGTGSNFPYYPAGVHVTRIDLSGEMLALGQKRAKQDDLAVRLLEMDAQDLRFAPDTFDCAVSTCVFCSVPDPVRGLREVGRVLKRGGKIVMLEHVRGPGILGPLFDLLNPLAVRSGGANINRRTVENVQRAGFDIERVESYVLGVVKLIVARKR